MWQYCNTSELFHHGVLGMKWGVKRTPERRGTTRYNDDLVIKKGTEIHRIIPKSWVEKEKSYSGHAYASYKKEDIERYKKFARIFGDGNNYVDMTFKVKDIIVSPSKKKRVDEFVKLMDSNPEARKVLLRSTRNLITFMPKNRLNRLDDPEQAEKAYQRFSFLLVSERELRDPYFKQLEDQGYSMILDDADIRGGISSSPIIVFDRTKTLSLKTAEAIGRGGDNSKWMKQSVPG